MEEIKFCKLKFFFKLCAFSKFAVVAAILSNLTNPKFTPT